VRGRERSLLFGSLVFCFLLFDTFLLELQGHESRVTSECRVRLTQSIYLYLLHYCTALHLDRPFLDYVLDQLLATIEVWLTT
jgi:hypothetical protein